MPTEAEFMQAYNAFRLSVRRAKLIGGKDAGLVGLAGQEYENGRGMLVRRFVADGYPVGNTGPWVVPAANVEVLPFNDAEHPAPLPAPALAAVEGVAT